MDEREALIAKITDKATKKAKAKKMNAAQTKLYVEEEVKNAVTEKTQTTNEQKTDKQEPAEEVKKAAEEVKKAAVKKHIVYTPVKNYCGEVAGVQFAYGKAEVKPGWILNWFKEHGYRVEEVSE